VARYPHRSAKVHLRRRYPIAQYNLYYTIDAPTTWVRDPVARVWDRQVRVGAYGAPNPDGPATPSPCSLSLSGTTVGCNFVVEDHRRYPVSDIL